jgi:hypothetical protein
MVMIAGLHQGDGILSGVNTYSPTVISKEYIILTMAVMEQVFLMLLLQVFFGTMIIID